MVLRRVYLYFSLLIAGFALGVPVNAASASAFRIRAVAAMGHSRAFAAATALPTGQVLITGGVDASYNYLADAELYDPRTQRFTPVGPMTAARASHTATLLPDGEVLVAGGTACSGGKCRYLSSVELFDPGTQRFVAAGNMTVARANHTATLLADGTVLIAGGFGADALANAELYDPAAGTFVVTSTMVSARYLHSAALLNTGQVLIAGGRGCADECDDNQLLSAPNSTIR